MNTCTFFWGTTDEVVIRDAHDGEHTVILSLQHKCGLEADHDGSHVCPTCNRSYLSPEVP